MANPKRFRPLVDLYREAGCRTGHSADKLIVGLHAMERGVDPLGGVGHDVPTTICPVNCYHCYQIDLYFSVRDDLGLTRRYSRASEKVVTNSGI